MVTVNIRALTSPVGIVRILEVIFTCISFSLAASVITSTDSFWTFCMFTWCLCFAVTILILTVEFCNVNGSLYISWDDFTTAFAMLATLMELSASIIFANFFTCSTCAELIAACVTSFLAFILYATEVGLTRARAGEISGFLSTVPGLLKVLEAYVACIIFVCVQYVPYDFFPGLQWCVAVYSICLIFALLVIIFTICRLLSLFPAPFDKVLIVCNVLAVLMYITAVVIWPYYSLKDNPRPSYCNNFPNSCGWNLLVVISVMTCVNLIAYIVDTFYSFRLVFFISRT
nr:myeloid-associated differentiation marker homolog [Nerophis lumbriciformis]